jgi:hypothetical protein
LLYLRFVVLLFKKIVSNHATLSAALRAEASERAQTRLESGGEKKQVKRYSIVACSLTTNYACGELRGVLSSLSLAIMSSSTTLFFAMPQLRL